MKGKSAEKIDPTVHIVPIEVTLADVNLMYQHVYALEDVNIMVAFATFFGGATVSFFIALVTSQTSSQSILFCTSTIFSMLSTIIFFVLTIRKKGKIKEIQKRLFYQKDSEQ